MSASTSTNGTGATQADAAKQGNAPYTRLDVPLTANALGSGTYLRLGAYVEGEEGAMMPALAYSKSTTTNTTRTAPEPIAEKFFGGLISVMTADSYKNAAATANAATAASATNADGSTKQGYLKRGDTFVKNKAGQMELLSIATTAVTSTSSGNGFLAKTDGDLNLNVGGGALVKINKGQTVQIDDGDVNFAVPAGAFAVSALSGISLTAGSSAAPANISLIAYGYVKQEAKGPVSEWHYSTSEKKTYGFAKDWFYGEKYSEFHGTSTSKFYGDEDKTFHGTATSYFLGEQITTNIATRLNMTMAATITLAMGSEFRLNMAADLKINLSIDVNIIIGIASKIVVGLDMKHVVGVDSKFVLGLDYKAVTFKAENKATSIDNTGFFSSLGGFYQKLTATKVETNAVKVDTGVTLKQ